MKKIIFLLLAVLMLFVIVGCASQKDISPETRAIKGLNLSMKDKPMISGVFVLGVGFYNQDSTTIAKYYLYIKGREGFRFQEISAKNVELVETNETIPSIKGYFYDDGSINEYRSDYVMYVPVGTIYEEYRADITSIGKEEKNEKE